MKILCRLSNYAKYLLYLKISEPIYKCYRKKGHCHICNSLSNIICMSCSSHNYIKEEIKGGIG